jgi:hypothetical protein
MISLETSRRSVHPRLLSIESGLALTSAQRFYQPLRCVATEPLGSRIDRGRKNGSRRGIYFPGEEFQQIGLRHLQFHFRLKHFMQLAK